MKNVTCLFAVVDTVLLCSALVGTRLLIVALNTAANGFLAEGEVILTSGLGSGTSGCSGCWRALFVGSLFRTTTFLLDFLLGLASSVGEVWRSFHFKMVT